MKRLFRKMYDEAVDLNHENILRLFERNPQANFLDLGCDDGRLTSALAQKIGTSQIFGVEVVPEMARDAQKRGIKVSAVDLNGKLDFEDDYFDVVHANQVLEHLYNSDIFLGEIYRVLKPGGYTIISTENGSSWSNIFAASLGWQIFSLTNITSKSRSIGNPFAVHLGENSQSVTMRHIRIYNIRGLKEYLEIFGLSVESIRGAGYFPLPAFLGNIDKTHCHFMTFKARK